MTQRVGINGNYSKFEKVTSGILFVNFINDLPEFIHIAVRLYADDSKLLGRVKAIEHVNRVQASLNNLVVWAGLWNMFFSLKKCHHLHIGNVFPDTEYTMETQNGTIKVTKVDT